MALLCPSSVSTSLPEVASQSAAAPLKPEVASCLPSGLKATPSPLAGRLSNNCCAPVVASQTRAVLSSLTVARRVPSGLKATLETVLVWPENSTPSRPVATSQILAVLSPPAVANRFPSGLKATLFIDSDRVYNSSPDGKRFATAG